MIKNCELKNLKINLHSTNIRSSQIDSVCSQIDFALGLSIKVKIFSIQVGSNQSETEVIL